MKKSCIIIVLLSLFCIGCKIHCPEFPTNLNYFPYYEGQVLKFVNSKYDIRSFTITNKENSEPESFGWNCKCECYIFTSFTANSIRDTSSIGCKIHIGGRGEVSIVHLSSRFQNNSDNEILTKTIDIGKFIPYEKLDKYLDDTIIIENENNQIVKRVVIFKGKGLVSYTTADGEEWNLVADLKTISNKIIKH